MSGCSELLSVVLQAGGLRWFRTFLLASPARGLAVTDDHRSCWSPAPLLRVHARPYAQSAPEREVIDPLRARQTSAFNRHVESRSMRGFLTPWPTLLVSGRAGT